MSIVERDGEIEEDQRYFVHGTTTALWRDDTIDPARGGGDFGAGFYAFEDTGWGRRAAALWARRKAGAGGAPILVRVRIRGAAFEALDRRDVPAGAFDEVRRLYARSGLMGKELIVGPVGRRGPQGRRVPDHGLPLQYKFEGTGIAKLVVDDIIPVR